MTFDEIFAQVTSLSMDERVEFASRAFGELWEGCKVAGFSDETISYFVTNVLKAAVSADHFTSEQERLLYNALFQTNLTYKQFFDKTNGGSGKRFAEAMDEVVDRLPESAKRGACSLALAFMSADGLLTEEEKELFVRFLG